jgi:hypothetical protein
MFRFLDRYRRSSGSAVMEPEQTETVAVPDRMLLQPAISDTELAEYVKVAKRIQFTPPDLLRHRLVQFMLENNIEVYPLAIVEKYLDSKFGIPSYPPSESGWEPKWSWHPLRSADVGKLTIITDNERSLNGQIEKGQSYRKIVPLPVLETVDRIATHFAGSEPALHFYVADAAVPSEEKDPFLAVTAMGIEFLVIERWDEPSFRR